jgi:hypothetical protein
MLTQEPKIRLNMLGQNLKQLERGIDIKSFKAMSDKMMTKLNVSLPQQEALVQSLSNPANKDSLSQLHGPKFNDMLKKNIIKLNLMTNDWQAFTAFEKWVQKYRPSYIKLQDLVVLDVMRSNPEKPIHFASTVGKNNYMGFENFMALEGMVYTLNRFSKKAPKDFNLEKTLALVDSTYQFRGINDGTYINDETMRLLSNYNSIFIRIALDAREEIAKAQYMSQQMQGAAKPEFLTKKIESKLAEGISYLEKGISLFPKEWRLYVVGADLYSIAEDFDAAIKQIEKGISAVEAWDVPILERKKQEIEGAALQAKARKEAALKAMATAVPTPAVETK